MAYLYAQYKVAFWVAWQVQEHQSCLQRPCSRHGALSNDLEFALHEFFEKFHDGNDNFKAIDMAIYSASVIDKATRDCTLDGQIIGQAAKIVI